MLQRQGTTPVLHHQGIMVAMKAATKTQDGVIPFIEGALVEHATRYEVARHIVRRTYSAYERLPLGAIVLHPDRGRGTIVEVLPDLRRVVRFDKGGEAHRYSPHSLYKLVQNPHRKPTAQLPCVSSCQTSTADATSKNTETAAEDLTHGGAAASRVPSKEPSWNTLSMIRAGEIAALQHLESNEKSKADELNALRSLPSQALRQRSMVKQRSCQCPGSAPAPPRGTKCLVALGGMALPQREAEPLGVQPLPRVPGLPAPQGCRFDCPLAMQAARHRPDQCAPAEEA